MAGHEEFDGEKHPLLWLLIVVLGLLVGLVPGVTGIVALVAG
ncbi:hypothetical protein ACN2MM_05870 [Alkalilimnicola ehrlichii MLHE-1]|nr:hypothetical protein [Alkalilimnicola ehrlichii]